jgi:hypothetical protein
MDMDYSAGANPFTPTQPYREANVNAMAAILDELRPGWATLVDLDRLDIQNPRMCILGQVFAAQAHQEWNKLMTGYNVGLYTIMEWQRRTGNAVSVPSTTVADPAYLPEWQAAVRARLAPPAPPVELAPLVEPIEERELELVGA